MHPQLELAGLAGRVGYQIAKEKVLRPRPLTLRDVPPGVNALTPEWLTIALCDGVPGAEVLAYEFGPLNDGTSSRRTMRVTYNDVGRNASLPEALFTKSAPTFLTRMVGAGARLAVVEAMFYTHVRPMLEIEAPVGWYSGYDPVSHRQMLITDDVAVTRNASFGSALDRTLTRQQADELIDTFAALHGRFWRAPLRRMFGSWLQTSYELTETLNAGINAAARILSGFDRARDVIPPKVYDRRAELHSALMQSEKINCTSDPLTFLHGDVHPGNWYVTGDGHMGLYDWSICVIGGPGRDLAYALSTHLPVADRREWEVALLERYLEKLEVTDPPSFDELWLSYRQQVCYAMLAWLATIGRGPLQPKYQPDDISLANIERITQAFEDLETLETVQYRDRQLLPRVG
jgi:thiamine kinase-like enzyme